MFSVLYGLLVALFSATALADDALFLSSPWVTVNTSVLSQPAISPLKKDVILENGKPVLLNDLKFSWDEARNVYQPELIVDPEQIQSLFLFDEKKFVADQDAKDFLDAKWKLYRNIRYDFKLKSYLPSTPRLSDWMALVHPPIRKLSQPLSFYSKKAGEPSQKHSPRQTLEFQQKIDQLSGNELTSGNSIQFLKDREVSDSRLKIARMASTTLWGGVLFMVCDAGTESLIQILSEKVKQGVDVRIMLDYFMQSIQKGNCVRKLRELGVKVLLVKGMISHRSAFHMKMWIADLKAAQIEGMNMIDAQTLATGFNHLYHDSGLSFEGPLVTDAYSQYIALWNRYSKEPLPAQLSELTHKQKQMEEKQELRGAGHYQSWLNSSSPVCRLVTQDRKTEINRISKVYFELLKSAQDSIIVTSVHRGYRLSNSDNDAWHQRLFTELVRKSTVDGVQVDLISNSDQHVFSALNIPSSGIGSGGKLNPLMALIRYLGIASADRFLWTESRVFEEISRTNDHFRAWSYMDFSHMKVALIDRNTVIGGSFNPFTSRSNRDAELVVVCQDKNLSLQMNEQLIQDLANSTPLPWRSQQ